MVAALCADGAPSRSLAFQVSRDESTEVNIPNRNNNTW